MRQIEAAFGYDCQYVAAVNDARSCWAELPAVLKAETRCGIGAHMSNYLSGAVVAANSMALRAH